jgi:hypothetical protein
MKQYRITPINRKRGLRAPFVTVYADPTDTGKKIERMAREKSGLGRFEEWDFGDWGQR